MSCTAVIPARKAEESIRATLVALLDGSGDFIRRILVVTAAGDPTASVVTDFGDSRVRVLASAFDRSAGQARNDGRAACTDDLVLFVDADCRLEAGGAAALARELSATGAAAVTARIAGEGGLVARVRHILEFKEAASRRKPPVSWLPPSTVMLCRAEAFDRAGGFPDLWPGEDLVFAQALRDLGLLVHRSDCVVAVHRHPPGFREMLAHQRRLGTTAAIARMSRPMPGSAFARSPWTAALLLPARALRIAAWQLREGLAASAWTLLLCPLIAAGLVAWTAGFLAAVAGHRGQARYAAPSFPARSCIEEDFAAQQVQARGLAGGGIG